MFSTDKKIILTVTITFFCTLLILYLFTQYIPRETILINPITHEVLNTQTFITKGTITNIQQTNKSFSFTLIQEVPIQVIGFKKEQHIQLKNNQYITLTGEVFEEQILAEKIKIIE